MGGKGDHKLSTGLRAEGQAKPATTVDALDPLAAGGKRAAGRTSNKAHALMAEYSGSIGWHNADHWDALPKQRRRLGAGLGGGIDHHPLGGCQPDGGLIGRLHWEVGERPGRPQMTAGPRQLEQQGLIDTQRIDRIRPLITGDAMTEERACRKFPHLSNKFPGLDAGGACAELIPVPAGAIPGFCIAALIASQGTGGGTGEPAGAGDRDRAGFGIPGRKGQRSAMGGMDSHGCGDAGPALPARRPARASPVVRLRRSAAAPRSPQRLARLTLAQARSMEGPADDAMTW